MIENESDSRKMDILGEIRERNSQKTPGKYGK
jgi:hypothetical protein